MNKRSTNFILVIGLLSIFMASIIFYIWQIFKSPNILVQQEGRVVYIYPGTDWEKLREQLYEDSVVNNMVAFGFAAKIMNYQENIKPGRYYLEGDTNTVYAIRKLRKGEQDPVKVTFNNIRTKEDLAGAVCKNLLADSAAFLSLLKDSSFLADYGLDTISVKSIFLPDTYFIYWTKKEKEVFERFYYEYNQFWTEERKQKADMIGLTPHEVAVLASIVDGETKMSTEKPIVAGLYINRLKREMLLQADPTVKYAVGDFTLKRVLTKHTEYDSPYNTYKYTGLPPGVISIPSKTSVNAVLNYTDHNYYYMCAQPNYSGYHDFAKSNSEHNRNANAYRRWLNSEGIR